MFGLLIASALATASPQWVEASSISHEPVSPAAIMAIPAALKEDFRANVTSKSILPQRRMELLVRYLFLPSGLGITYQHDATHTVAEAYQQRTANCLTFTLLTIALAREAGLEAYGQDMSNALLWWQHDNTLYRTTHVNAGLRIDQRRFTVDVASEQVMTLIPPRRIKDSRLLAQFYNNRSAMLIAQDQLELALLYSRMALEQDSTYEAGWNNAGVLHARANRPDLAEQHYLKALELNPSDPSALSNLHQHYLRIGASARAAPLRKRLQNAQRNNPFHQFMLAVEAENRGQFEDANRYYRQAIRLHKHEPRFHDGLIRTYQQLGKTAAAERAQQRARELNKPPSRSLTQTTLDPSGQRQL